MTKTKEKKCKNLGGSICENAENVRKETNVCENTCKVLSKYVYKKDSDELVCNAVAEDAIVYDTG